MEGEGPLWMKAVFLYSFFFLLLSLFMLLVNSVWSCVSDDAEKNEAAERKSLINSRAPGIPGNSMRKLKPYEFERLVTIDYDAENYQSSYWSLLRWILALHYTRLHSTAIHCFTRHVTSLGCLEQLGCAERTETSLTNYEPLMCQMYYTTLSTY